MSNDQIADIRREYDLGTLTEAELHSDPIEQFNAWLAQAIEHKIKDPTAMTVATVDNSGQPSQRIVLLKDVSKGGFVFYTNTDSRKAQEIKQNNKVSLHFPWHILERQVKVCGVAEPLSTAEVTRYFLSRPKESQLAAWASEQSRPIATRQLLLNKFHEVKEKFKAGDVPLPSFWGGYRVIPTEIEFWQGGEYRLHDRFVYRQTSTGSDSGDNSNWSIERLMP